MDQGRCRSCGKPVLWCTMASLKKNPLDPDPVTIPAGQPEALLVQIWEEDGLGRAVRGRQGYRSHFITCPNARQHRKAPDPKPKSKKPPEGGLFS